MKTVAVAFIVLLAAAGAAGAARHPSLRAVKLAPPTFRGSGFQPNERITVSVRGTAVPSVRVVTDAQGRFRARLAPVAVCTAWTARAVGARGGTAVYHHARCAALDTDVAGTVKRMTKNVCGDQTPCTGPAPGVTVQAFEDGVLVAQTKTDANGNFSFSLASGDYTFDAIGQGAKPQSIHVTTSSTTHVSFLIDTALV